MTSPKRSACVELLLDTHIVLAWLLGEDGLGSRAEQQLEDPSDQLIVSAVVVWEVAIKRALGKLEVPMTFVADVIESDAEKLPVSLEHAAGVERLPHHHRDPFDRLLVSQALTERATIVSGNAAIADYDVPVLW
jgi:PIN domain nuclease of toxin-antitoxin system